ncbi:MAG TPA: indole-3-glycerol phosphate synthase TrpC [Steroidobacteraceae bacterium]|nr:indole-3-glycerol phosphate synthase TrpC [Steroidobacteraceae bacterium]
MSAAASGDFLAGMARASGARLAAARACEPDAALRQRAREAPAAPPLRLDPAGFDLIAELKLRSPAQGVLGAPSDDLEGRVRGYARAGAAIVSVLTEPERFDGSLAHLARASAALAVCDVPVMRKDFLVDPYQLLEARAAGAGGALLIVRMLGQAQLAELMAAAEELRLFVLLEAFDAADIATAGELAAGWRGRREECLIGINSRDLATLEVVAERLESLGSLLPDGFPKVAESGVVTAADAGRLAGRGFTLALVGSSLMSAADPEALVRDMIASGRRAARSR